MNDPTSGKGTALRVLSLESRRAAEMQTLIERHGGFPVIAPSMREVPLDHNPTAITFGEDLLAGRFHVIVFMTGVGATALMDVLCTRWSREQLISGLSRCVTVVRGPKPTAVLNGWGLRIDYRAPEPNTWRELLETLVAAVPLAEKQIAIQEYGKPSTSLYEALAEQGAVVTAVPVYRWELPFDVAPLKQAIQRTISGDFDVILFTSAQQFHNALEVAEMSGDGTRWLDAANRCFIGSIGPTASETLRDGGLRVDLEPSHPKMGPLVREVLQAASIRSK